MKFREKLGHITDPMNYIVVLIDDFNDFRKGGIKDIVFPICSLAQLGRATGIHLILATSNVSSSCIDGSIKTNFPARIALKLKDEKDYKFLFDDAGLTLNTAELRVQLDRKGKVRDLKRIFCIK
jgi:DNA segregation ATPase FtsK/SpoIIIE-like protein